MNCLNNFSVDAKPAAGMRTRVKIDAQKTANIGVRAEVLLPLVETFASSSLPTREELQ